ncbi:MAG: DUF3047 domain-containing protein [Alphaproteobacteria bacterium]|nr:DUF3047 domain-containing protein [Alphaproteobacteria bacterium]
MRGYRRFHAAALGAALLLAGCAGLATTSDRLATGSPAPAAAGGALSVLDVATMLQDGWRIQPVRGLTDFRIAVVDGALAVTATGRGGASGLIRPLEADPKRCRRLRWTWRVDAIQQGADLATRAGDDVAASVFVLFGDPGALGPVEPVPTLKYVWVGGDHAPGAIQPNPYMPDHVVNVVAATRDAPLGQWRTQTRDLYADYETAFGDPPEDWIEAVAIFTDNDQTGEPVTAHYRDIALICSET